MKVKALSVLTLTLLTLSLTAKHDSGFLNKITRDYVTPHYTFQQKKDAEPIRTLFILMRSGARDSVEVLQRMDMDAAFFTTAGRYSFAQEDMYESTHKGTSIFEKSNELSSTLNKEYDVYVIGQFAFAKLPEKAQYRILNDVRNGKSLIIIESGRVGRLPYRKLYTNPIKVPAVFSKFAQPSQKAKIEAWQVGKGKFITLSWNKIANTNGHTLLPRVVYSNQWKTQQENAAAYVALLMRYAAGKEINVSGKPVIRIRDAWNKDVTANKNALPAGTYYKDQLGANGAFLVEEFTVKSSVGGLKLNMNDTFAKQKAITGELVLGEPAAKTMTAVVELFDSPYGNVWLRKEIRIPANAKNVKFAITDYYMPTIAGYLRASVKDNKNVKDIAEKEVFFPNPSMDDYWQVGWDGPENDNGEHLARQTVDRLGWNLILNHPKQNGTNVRVSALLNMKMIPYMVRVCFYKSPKGNVETKNWFFLPSKFSKDLKALNGDHCFYRPEVQKLWAEGIRNRMINLPKYSAAVYNLGDENHLDLESGYGPYDLIYFRKFLEKKYKTIKNLNYNYKSNYKSFDEVPHMPLKEAKDKAIYPAWNDHREYIEQMYADAHAFLREEIRKYDPEAKVGAEGSEPGNLELTMKTLEYWGPYSNLVGDELLRSFGKEKIRSLWWGGYPGSHSGRSDYVVPLNKDLLLGTVNGNAWFAGNPGSNHSSVGCDLTIAGYVRKYLDDLDRLKNGSAQLMVRNDLINNGVYFYWSHPSTAAAHLDKRCLNPHDGLPSLIRSAYRTGAGFDFISVNSLERLKKAKLLFLCGTSALSEKECKAILDYVKNGGTVIADVNPAIMNENLRINETNPLKALFGNITFKNAETQTFKELKLGKFHAKRVPQGKQVFVTRKFGKGKAILFNFSIASAANTAASAAMFDQWFLSLMKNANAAPKFTVGKVADSTMVRLRQNKDFVLLGIMQSPQNMNQPVKVTFPQTYHVYNADGKYLGTGKAITANFKKSPLQLLSLFTQKQKAPSFSVANAVRGDKLKFALPALKDGRIYRLQISTPDGKNVFTHVFDRAQNLPVRAIAYNEPAGTWKATLTDVASGLTTKVQFTVK